VGIIDAAIIRLPILVPVTDIVWNEGIVGIRRFRPPKRWLS
jgi:hypothetical protein